VAAARERVERQVDVVMEGIEHASYAIRWTGGPRQLAGWSDTRATEEQLAALAASGIACAPLSVASTRRRDLRRITASEAAAGGRRDHARAPGSSLDCVSASAVPLAQARDPSGVRCTDRVEVLITSSAAFWS
jgi:hypothetical protein